MYTLGIDASNIQGGGGVTHLLEILKRAEPTKFGFSKIVVWGGSVLERISSQEWLVKRSISSRKLTAVEIAAWMLRGLPAAFSREKCDLLFSPGGTFFSRRIPYVSMSRNMLLYDDIERRRFPYGWTRLRYNILRIQQTRSFRYAKGVIFVSNHAKHIISQKMHFLDSKLTDVIHHGVDERFFRGSIKMPKQGRFTFLYVSRVSFYKHQWNVVRAIELLNHQGIDCRLKLIGGGSRQPIKKLKQELRQSSNTQWLGELAYSEIDREYHSANAFVFASTCENMPNILVEAMAAGLPIACSSFGPMPEIAGESVVYFDPTSVESTANCLRKIVESPELRDKIATAARNQAEEFSWTKTADGTFAFFAKCLNAMNDN